MKKVIVVGGGISGLCSAYYLVKEGYGVTLLDQTDMTNGASFINAGYITPSHFIPLAAPGIITQGLKWMLNSSSPLYIKPRWDMEFFKWALLFKKSATTSKVKKAIPVLKELNLKSRGLYEELLASHDFDFHYERKGVLMAYCSDKAEHEERKVAEQAIREGLEASILSKEKLQEIQPVFSDKVKGAVHYQCDAHMTPNHFMQQLKVWLLSQGVEFKFNQKVGGFTVKGKKIVSLKTQDSIFEADEFVLASGSWTSKLVSSIGLDIPIQGGKGYSTDVHRPTDITLPTILVDARMAITPMDGFTRFAGTMEFSGNNNTIKKERVEALAKAVKTHYRDVEIQPDELNRATSGLRPVSPDGLPYIGKTSKYQNLTIAAGHAMMGWSLGPVTGKLVAQEIAKAKTMVNLASLSPDRFK
ncbi:NAD(P)/FAD-dependent oxidoreductase [Flagellimonas halotolerans]|uniref:FAD-dependent oxidoreductase n=1 Tax=Flagellimonas halotolerans TaxID=3112164 RepID=A0ABU6IPY8_9FLAO|nr:MULTISPECIES: FAD-dependent oxidoreductase [unclassified Allomuricauda]MEC3965321.1 FAD-dependent oxidoreductase [Muricauda sp. SYSU M86414]MEC4265187.1 FAD-dependent oxidoreductase [Muricauda sp. SYSU M84420]